jgi:hypothetical protein
MDFSNIFEASRNFEMKKRENDGKERTNQKLVRRSPGPDSQCRKFSKISIYLMSWRLESSATIYDNGGGAVESLERRW